MQFYYYHYEQSVQKVDQKILKVIIYSIYLLDDNILLFCKFDLKYIDKSFKRNWENVNDGNDELYLFGIFKPYNNIKIYILITFCVRYKENDFENFIFFKF